MKKIIFPILLVAGILMIGCDKSKLEDIYPDPSKTSEATVENFFAGVLQSANDYVMPWYWRFFVVESPSMGHYTQVLGWVNSEKQYIPDASALNDRWTSFYTGPMSQYRELQRLYNNLSEKDKADKRIFYLAATIFFYDQTEQIADNWGNIPWKDAGKLWSNSGDLTASKPKYNTGEEIYTDILDDLKAIADELNAIQVPSFYAGIFAQKDYMNDGNLLTWRIYCNSLRLRMLMRVSNVPAFQSRATSEIAAILGNPDSYPVITENSEAIMTESEGPDMFAVEKGIREGFETWGTYNIAPKTIIDHMNANSDPRLPVMFDPNKNGEYLGLDPMLNSADQTGVLNDTLLARYDTATFSRNNFFPGFVITAAEVSFLKAEAYLRGLAPGGDAAAKEAYETGIRQSIELYYNINATGDFRTPLTPPSDGDITAYLAQPGISWDAGVDKIGLIAIQKWLNTGISQMPQTWAEMRRLNKPVLSFIDDPSSEQISPPVRWPLPDSEQKLNKDNYKAVESTDNLNSKVFWDVD